MDEEIIAAIAETSDSHLQERRVMRSLRDYSNPFEIPERRFLKLFRLPPARVHYLIEELDCEMLQSGSLPKHIKVLSALHFYAQGSYQVDVGQEYNLCISQPCVSRSVSTVGKLIIQNLTPNYIKFPQSVAEKRKNKTEFLELFGMPNTLGAIDCSHIGIIAPPLNHPTSPGNIFYNRKGFYSINCQMICDAQGYILNVNPNFPGSTHDAAIWRASQIHKFLEREYIQGETNQWLLGDKGYPLLPWLMTPIGSSTTDSEQQYNICHTNTRNIIEKVFGRLKNVFRCLNKHRILHYSPVKAAEIILSCATLHNIHKNVYPELDENVDDTESEDDDAEESASNIYQNNYLREGRETQRNLIHNYFS